MEDNKNYEENIDEKITDGECEDCSEGSCSSCSGCGNYKPDFDGPNVGKRVKVHYKGTFVMEHSLIHLMTEDYHLNLNVEQEE